MDSLGGEPGVYSARYAGPEATTRPIIGSVQKLGYRRRSDRAIVCVIALVRGWELVETFRGTVEGELLMSPRGDNGFGYDPLFYYAPFGCSFGEVSRERKQTVSHRGVALQKLLTYLKRKSA